MKFARERQDKIVMFIALIQKKDNKIINLKIQREIKASNWFSDLRIISSQFIISNLFTTKKKEKSFCHPQLTFRTLMTYEY